MRVGLKQKLNEIIKSRGEITVAEMEQICRDLGYKVSNGERRLRKSESPNVISIPNKKGATIAYRWEGVRDTILATESAQKAESGQIRHSWGGDEAKPKCNPWNL